jgi:hypothetical protein
LSRGLANPVVAGFFILLGLGGAGASVPDVLAGSAIGDTLIPIYGLFIAAGAVLMWLGIRGMKQTLHVFERGFVWRIGGKERVVPYVNVAGVRALTILRRGAQVGYEVTLTLRDGSRFTLTERLRDIEAFHRHLTSLRAQ